MRDAAVYDVLFFSPDRAFAAAFVETASESYLLRVAETARQLETALDNFALDLVLFHAESETDLAPLLDGPADRALPPTILLIAPILVQQRAVSERLLARGLNQFIPLPLETAELAERLTHHFARHPKPPEQLQFKRLYRAGEPIFLENEVGHECFSIVSGRVRACRVIDSHTLHEVNQLGPGEIFGEMALLRAARRSTSVLAIDDVIVTVTTRENFDRVVRTDPEFVGNLVGVMRHRIEEMESRLALPSRPASPGRKPKVRGVALEGGKRRSFRAGEALFVGDEAAHCCFVLESGRVQMRKTPKEANHSPSLGPGSLLGEVAHALGRPYGEAAVALEDCVCRVLDQQNLSALGDAAPALELRIAQSLAARLEELLVSLSAAQLHEVF